MRTEPNQTSEEKPQVMEQKPEKKKKRRKWPWILLAVIIILPLLFIGWTGLYNVPVLSNIFGSNKPIDLGVVVSEEALNSGLAKTNFTLKKLPEPPANLLDIEREYTGEVEIDHEITSNELTSFVANRRQNVADPIMGDVQLKFIDGGMELSGMLNKYINAPVYIKGNIAKASSNSVSIDLTNAKVGRFPVPGNYLQQFEDWAVGFINERLGQVDGFSIDKLEFKDGALDFVGTYPKTVNVVK
ncbi:MAG: hypothetical protein V1838_04870 [Patescibacteria group bacterium]